MKRDVIGWRTWGTASFLKNSDETQLKTLTTNVIY